MNNHMRALFLTSPHQRRQTVTRTFTSSGIWYKRPGLLELELMGWGAGGAGTSADYAYSGSGTGSGGAAGFFWVVIAANRLRRQETVTVGVPNGGTTSFAEYASAFGGGNGSAGPSTGAGGGGGSAAILNDPYITGIVLGGENGSGIGGPNPQPPGFSAMGGWIGRGGFARPNQNGSQGLLTVIEHYGVPIPGQS